MIDILFEDNHLLAVCKPAGLLTQPSGTERDSLEMQLKRWIKERDDKPGNVFLHAVHRLDTVVSGIVLFAKTSKALSRLNSAIRDRATKKVYLALVSHRPKSPEGELRHWLIHDDNGARVGKENDLGALEAILRYRTIQNVGNAFLLEVYPQTGRYHQIRLQLAAIGSPIVGDRRYGGIDWSGGDIALHHSRLEITHPVTRQPLVIEAPLTRWTR